MANEHDEIPGHDDAGQAAVLVVTVTAVLLVVILAGLASMGSATLDRVRAQTAADAAALASVGGDRTEADRLAEAHDAVVVSWRRGPGEHEVTVVCRVGTATATARASNAP